ncbi:DUF6443 domain-containing protein, partial [Cloacibacterium rupense]|uniref:DUF6443 domain-containing protein n=1 Tax=Cloacibacterium rupense TaxID=517423 RepID=UPI00166A3896
MKKILTILLGVLFVGLSAQTTPPTGASTTENYVYSRTYLEAVTTSSTTAKQVQGIQYFDGLGRPKQSIAIKASPLGRDVVTHIEYDPFGRQVKDYLPVPQSSSQNGTIYSSPLSNASASYGAEKIYSEKVLENSPLDRVFQQIQPGNDWSGKPIKFDYETNTSTDVLKFVTTTTWLDNATKSTLKIDATNKAYPANQLYKNKVTDEDGNVSYEFKNGEGQTLLVRKMLNATNGADTYYVYNEYNQLAFVIPPLAVDQFKNLTIGATILETDANLLNLCYQYRYDGQNRLVEKKLPGKGWEYMVYDQQDRLVLTQDANLGQGVAGNTSLPGKQWLFTKYDQFGRVLYTGIYTSTQAYGSAGRNAEQAIVDSKGANNETKSDTTFTVSGMPVYYTNSTGYPASVTKLLSVNYYDDYPTGSPTRPTSIFSINTLPNASYPNITLKGLPTASYVNNIENDAWTKSYTWYDGKARAIGSHSINYLGGYTKTETELDFAGVPQKTYTYHKRLSTDTEIIVKERFEYDGQNRLVKHFHQVNTNPEELLTFNEYNELGQLKNKKVGGTTTPLQTVDYMYNVRGWMTQVNNPTALGTDLFGFQINYQNPDTTKSSPTAKYNGNISQTNWSTASDQGVLRTYTYQYDKLNRLTSSSLWDQLSLDKGEYQENLTYDINGNIKSLYRTGKQLPGFTSPEKMDDLEYYYENNDKSNRLSYLKEKVNGGNATSGYPLSSGQQGQNITYDANGNMTSQLDKNITSIKYNYLNLPVEIQTTETVWGSNGVPTDYYTNTKYTYNASGEKLKKEFTFFDKSYAVYKTRITNYINGFQYDNSQSNGVYQLLFIPTTEGYVKNNPYGYESTTVINNISYIYNYVDHLGNVRLSYADSNKNGVIDPSTEIIEENNYYPFGLKHSGYNNLAG